MFIYADDLVRRDNDAQKKTETRKQIRVKRERLNLRSVESPHDELLLQISKHSHGSQNLDD